MLAKPEEFRAVEEALKAMGVLEKFEKENGPVLGRAMITLTEIPESIPVQREDRENLTAFEISFDFCNVALGIAVDVKKKTLETSVWGRSQTPGAERPTQEWVKFFLSTLFEHIGDDGSFGIPMYSFVNNTSDFTVVPAESPPDAPADAETESKDGRASALSSFIKEGLLHQVGQRLAVQKTVDQVVQILPEG